MTDTDKRSSVWMSVMKQAWGDTYFYADKPASGDRKQFYLDAFKKRHLFLNFLGFPLYPKKSIARTLVAIPTLPFSLVKNTAKLFTEFLFSMLFRGFLVESQKMRWLYEHTINQPKKLGYKRGYLFQGIANVFRGLHFVGCAITSPVRGIQKAYRFKLVTSGGREKRVPKPLGLALAVLSSVITVAVYTVLLPLIMPVIIAKLPAAVLAGVSHAMSTPVGLAFMKGFAFVGQHLGLGLQALGIAAAPAAMVGAVSLVSAVVPAGTALAEEGVKQVSKKMGQGNTQTIQAGLNANPAPSNQGKKPESTSIDIPANTMVSEGPSSSSSADNESIFTFEMGAGSSSTTPTRSSLSSGS